MPSIMPVQLNKQQLNVVQQHRLLQQLQIDIWVSRHATVTEFDPLVKQLTAFKVDKTIAGDDDNKVESFVEKTTPSLADTSTQIAPITNPNIVDTAHSISPQIDKDSSSVSTNIENNETHQPISTDKTIQSFSLKGFYRNNWVVIVDMAHLTEEQQKLWESLSNALNVSCDVFNFPNLYLDKNMMGNDQTNSVDMANIHFLGFINRLTLYKQEINIACLTQLTEGLADTRIKQVPTLKQMLEDANKKRELWQLLNDTPE